MERGAFHLMRIGNAMRRGSEDRFVGQVLANIMATCIIARVLAHNLDVWFVSWLTSNVLDVCLPFSILATCIIARVLTPTMDAWFLHWSTSKMLDVRLSFSAMANTRHACVIVVMAYSACPDPAFAWSFIFMV